MNRFPLEGVVFVVPGKSKVAATVVPRRYAKIDAAAEYLDVHPITIRQMIADGRIHAYRSGTKLLRVDLNEIDQLLTDGGEDRNYAYVTRER
jgi:excisionase family DNA binding protein